MSADTTNEKVESSTTEQKPADIKPPMQAGGGGANRGGFRRGGGGGGGGVGGAQKFGVRRQNTTPYPKSDEKKRFKPNNFNNQQNDNQGHPNHGGGGGGGGGRGGMHNKQTQHDRIIKEKLNDLAGPTLDLPPVDNKEKKFTSRGRLFIGNLPLDITDTEVTELFKQYGEISELFINKEKHFGFLRMDYQHSAEKAKNDLESKPIRGKYLKIRFAPNGTTVKVRNLDEFVTNELLAHAFSIFGDINKCVVVVDDRGKTTGEGYIEFARKVSAANAVEKCNENCFFLTSTPRPVIVEMNDANDEIDGHCERYMNKKNQEFYNRRNVGPRFAKPDSFENEYGMRWKNLHELYNQKIDSIKKELAIEQDKLIAQMELARYEHETSMLREQLRAREMNMDRQKKEWEMKEQQADEARRTADQEKRVQEQEMQARMMQQDEEMRRRQDENKLFMQAQQLDNMLNHQEQAYEQGPPEEMFDRPPRGNDNNGGGGGYNNRFDQPPNHNMRGGFGHGGGFGRGGGGGNNGGRWMQNRNDFYQRRKF